MYKKIFISLFLGFISLPSLAYFDGKVEKQYFYDNANTIMYEDDINNSVKTDLYWTDNVLNKNKYRPTFMLSNHDITYFVPKQQTIQRNQVPCVYNVSFKNTTMVKVSLSNNTTPKNNVSNTKPKAVTNTNYAAMYEKAKIGNTTVEQKMSTVLILKSSNNPNNYSMAISLLDDITRIEPFNAYAFYLKGELYTLKKDYENAMKNYVASLKINPTNKKCYISIAKILETKNKTLAQKYYAKANSINL